MKNLSAPTLAALSSGQLAIVQLIYFAFSTTPVALNTSTWDLDFGGVTYKGARGLGTVSPVNDKPGEVEGLTFELFGDAASVALALDEANLVQGTVCTIRTAILNSETYQILDAPLEWVGRLDIMSISEDGETCAISVTAESKAADLISGNSWLYTVEDQARVNPYDGAFKYVVDQVDKPIIWPAKAFYYQ